MKLGSRIYASTPGESLSFPLVIEVEDILQKIGVPVSVVINSLYRQIIYRRGIPFSLVVPEKPKTLGSMTKAELDAKLQHSYNQSLNGEGRPLEAVFDELERGLI